MRTGLLSACVVALTLCSSGYAHFHPKEMVKAANSFIASLDDDQKKLCLFEFKSDDRQGWYFVPDKYIRPRGARIGLVLKKMDEKQRDLVMGLLKSAASEMGHKQVTQIMSLESILHVLERNNPIRDPELYYVSIFGTPSTKKSWSWRYEGHHLSINCTVVDGKNVIVTPSFFGSNPGEVKEGSHKGLKVLRQEEELARALAQSLTDKQKKRAIIAERAPRDILTKQMRKAEKKTFFPPKGIKYSDLDSKQQTMLTKLVNVYTAKYKPVLIKHIDGRANIHDTKSMYFAWAGSLEPGKGHYYRVQTSKYLFEYDNTQNRANHVHAVWRDFDGDFGEDLLLEHLKKAHSK